MVKSLIKDIYLSLRKFVLKILVKNKSCEGISPESVDSIIVIRIDRIGDCVVSLPAIKALKRVFPKAALSVLVKKAHATLMKQAGYIDEVIVYDGFFSTVRILRKKHFFLAVDLLKDYTVKTALLALWSKAKITAGFAIEDRGRLFDFAFYPSEEKKRMSSHLMDLVRFIAQRAGIDRLAIVDEAPEITLTPELKAFAGEFLFREGVSKENIMVGLAPGAKFPSQRWSLENFAQLADRLLDQYNARIVVIASKQEEKVIATLASLVTIKPILAVGLPLDKLASVIASMRILICNNSGPLHLAAALGVPTVSTMGPTDPALWWPHGENNIVINKQLPCSPCNRADCAHHSCLAQISVTEIEQAVGELLKKEVK